MPRLAPGTRADAPKPPALASAKDAAFGDETTASARAGAARPDASESGAARPSDVSAAPHSATEDYGYTYQPPAWHTYGLPADQPPAQSDRHYLIDLALRVSAVLAVIYLVSHSDLPYLVGFTRRRRKND